MGAWSGDWNLNSASATYPGYAVGKFSLKRVSGKYEVTTTDGSATAKWLGAMFTEVSGSGEPSFPWPMPATPTPALRAKAVEYLAEKMSNQRQAFDGLQGQVTINGVSVTVRLFKVNGGTVMNPATGKKHDFLACFRQALFDGTEAGGGGGASGVRP